MRVGIGFDVHQFIKGRALFLGGVRIPHPRGLKGHSDGDALIHAVIDAVLGASGKGDKGKHFPDTSPKFKDISSSRLLQETMRITAARIINLDCIILCEKPMLTKYYAAMKKNLSGIMGISAGSISIKATRTEGIGIKEDGIACFCACLIRK